MISPKKQKYQGNHHCNCSSSRLWISNWQYSLSLSTTVFVWPFQMNSKMSKNWKLWLPSRRYDIYIDCSSSSSSSYHQHSLTHTDLLVTRKWVKESGRGIYQQGKEEPERNRRTEGKVKERKKKKKTNKALNARRQRRQERFLFSIFNFNFGCNLLLLLRVNSLGSSKWKSIKVISSKKRKRRLVIVSSSQAASANAINITSSSGWSGAQSSAGF